MFGSIIYEVASTSVATLVCVGPAHVKAKVTERPMVIPTVGTSKLASLANVGGRDATPK